MYPYRIQSRDGPDGGNRTQGKIFQEYVYEFMSVDNYSLPAAANISIQHVTYSGYIGCREGTVRLWKVWCR